MESIKPCKAYQAEIQPYARLCRYITLTNINLNSDVVTGDTFISRSAK
jgi:hypothetical protein